MNTTLVVFDMTNSNVVYITATPVIIYLLPSDSSAIDLQKVLNARLFWLADIIDVGVLVVVTVVSVVVRQRACAQ
jgi:hypothetical protein